MANPPIQIGMFTNVPAPGSPIVSNWTQSISPRAVHYFATAAARTTAWPSPPTGAVSLRADCGYLEFFNGTIWRPMWGQLITSVVTPFPDLARTATGLIDVVTVDAGTFPYPTILQINSSLVGGFSVGASSFNYDLVITQGSVVIPTGGFLYPVQAPANFWAAAGELTHSIGIAAGQPTSWKARINPTNVGGGTFHTGGYGRTLVFAA